MRIDRGLARSLINRGDKERLLVARSTFLGGVPYSVGESALGFWQLRNASSLKGCIINFYIDDKIIDFLQASKQRNGILSGCFQRYLLGTSSYSSMSRTYEKKSRKSRKKEDSGRRQDIGKRRRDRGKKGCLTNKCRPAGTRSCKANGRRNYKCRCKRGFAGRYCKKAPTCRKKKTKRYYYENGCRSRKLISMKGCQGACHGGHCCKPKKLKKKRVKLICQDGTRYIKTIDMVKKCSCRKEKKCRRKSNVHQI